jgi:hypothetical protein
MRESGTSISLLAEEGERRALPDIQQHRGPFHHADVVERFLTRQSCDHVADEPGGGAEPHHRRQCDDSGDEDVPMTSNAAAEPIGKVSDGGREGGHISVERNRRTA